MQPAAKLIARDAGLPPGVSCFWHHGSCLPRDQSAKAIGRNDRASAYAVSLKASGRDMSKDGRSAETCGVAGFSNAVCELWGIWFDGLHCIGPILARADMRRTSWDGDQASLVGETLGVFKIPPSPAPNGSFESFNHRIIIANALSMPASSAALTIKLSNNLAWQTAG